MCASALYQIKIKRIVYGAKNPRFGGLGSMASNQNYQHKHSIEVKLNYKSTLIINLFIKFIFRL